MTMSQVLDKVDATSLGEPSVRRVSGGVSFAGGAKWITTFGGGATAQEVPPTVAAVSEFDYHVAPRVIHYSLGHTENGGFLATEPMTGIFGFGRDRNEALRDLFRALHEHQDVLQRQGSLSAGLRAQLDYLTALL